MPESIDVSAKTVADAIAIALQRLGKKRDDVDVDILSEGSRGILGIGAEDARIRVRVRPPAKPPVVEKSVAPAKVPAAAAEKPAAPAKAPAAVEEKPAAPKRAPRRAAPVLSETVARLQDADRAQVPGVPDEVVAAAKETVEQLLSLMGLRAHVTMRGAEPRGVRTPDEDTPTCTADIGGDDLGILIGRRGENLSALQYITNLIVAKRTGSDVRVVVDVEHYLVRRYNSLKGLAQRMAERVRQSGMPITLEPMPPHERRIVHLTLADSPDVSTNSIGEGEARRVVISPRKQA